MQLLMYWSDLMLALTIPFHLEQRTQDLQSRAAIQKRYLQLCQAINDDRYEDAYACMSVLAEKPIRSVIDREKDDWVRGERGLS